MTDALVNSHTNGFDDPNRVLNTNGVNGDLHPVNGLNGASPTPAGSPSTPVSVNVTSDVKIDMDFQQESDARHEPLPIKHIDKLDRLEAASTIAQVASPVDPEAISITPPKHTPTPPAEDVRMGDDVPAKEEDVPMEAPTPSSTMEIDTANDSLSSIPTVSPSQTIEASTSYTTPNEYSSQNDDDSHGPPPAKRARKHSDADQASLAHSATPPPASASTSALSDVATPVPPSATPTPTPPGISTLSTAQFRFAQGIIRQLKKLKDAGPFLNPVDPVVLNIPHYPNIIKSPMDFSTIERKLASSNPAKPDLTQQNPRYYNAEEFINDVRLIFSNCVTFNGPDHLVTAMGKRVEEVFDKQVKHMPPALEVKPVIVKKATPPPPPPVVPQKKTLRRASTSVPVIRRSDTEQIGRPKREIHPPPPKDLPYADIPKKHRKMKRVKDDGTSEQLKFCAKLLADLNRKQHWTAASPFYDPVDWVALEIPNYPKVVKKPMDLGTMRRKLENQDYPTAQKFHDDFKLMIRNCFSFNPHGTPVNQAGIELQRLFDEKWKNLPALHEVSDEESEEEEENSDDERARTIAMMEAQMETMRATVAQLKAKPKEKKKKEKREKHSATASSSKASGKAAKGNGSVGGNAKKRGKNKPVADDDVLTFEQKKDLSEAIQKLDGSKLERVIQIIHEGVPEIRDSTEEIELEIDLLPASVLTKLYNFVLRPLRSPATKRNRTGKGTGTGGLKRKSMDEDVEAEKIRQLEERMKMFEPGGGASSAGYAATGGRTGREDDSEHSSDSSSDDSSGSDSE